MRLGASLLQYVQRMPCLDCLPLIGRCSRVLAGLEDNLQCTKGKCKGASAPWEALCEQLSRGGQAVSCQLLRLQCSLDFRVPGVSLRRPMHSIHAISSAIALQAAVQRYPCS